MQVFLLGLLMFFRPRGGNWEEVLYLFIFFIKAEENTTNQSFSVNSDSIENPEKLGVEEN